MTIDVSDVSVDYRQAGGYAQTVAFPDSGPAPAADMALLIIEDDPFLTEHLCCLVEAKGYQALFARSGEEALRLYSSCTGCFAMVITDPRLPGMRGKAMIEALLRLKPQTLLLVVSDSGSEAADDSRKRGVPLLRHFLGL